MKRKTTPCIRGLNVSSYCRLLFMAILLAASLQLSAQIDKQISVDFVDVPAYKALTKVEQLAGIDIQFNRKDLNFKVTLKANNEKAVSVVERMLRGHGLAVKQLGKALVVTKATGVVQVLTEGTLLNGVVVDENGEPLMGATVRVPSTNDATVTNQEGKYSLVTTTTSGRIEVSYIGYETKRMDIQELAKKGKVALVPDKKLLNDVVVTGFFDKEKSSFTGAVKKITHDDIVEFGTTNVLNVMAILDPSFRIKENNASGSNPNELPDFVVRGESSFQGSSLPTIIVDGYEVDVKYLYDMDVERIESISILKDASATVYYGSRAANGVLIIETRRPEAGKLRVSYSNHTGLTFADLSSYHLMNASQKLEFERLSGIWNSPDPQSNFERQQQYEALKRNVAQGIDTYWISQPLRTGVTSSHSLYAEGGDNVVTYGLSGYYSMNDGVMKGSDRDNFSISFDLGYRLKDRIKIRNSFSYSEGYSNNSPYGSFSSYTAANPYSPIYDEAGNYIKVYNQHQSGGTAHYNPLYDASLPFRNWSKSVSMRESFQFDYRVTQSLRWRVNFGYSRSSGESQSYVSPNNSRWSNSTVSASDKGQASSSHDTSTGWDLSTTLANNFTFGKHGIYVGAGVNLTESSSYSDNYSVKGFVDDRFNQIGDAAKYNNESVPSSSSVKSRLVGFLANLNYSFDNRYFADLSARLDGSSAYGADNRFGTLWSAGLGWNINNEKFMKENAKWIDNLRLRGSYGVTGSSNFDQSVARTTLKFNQSQLYYETLGATFIQYGNRNLSWQKNEQMNIGLDFGIVKRRLNFQFNYYKSTINGLLLPVTTPYSMGFSNYTENFGEIENRGYEFDVNAVVVRTKDFDLGIHANASHNENVIKKINEALQSVNEGNNNQYQAERKVVTQYEEGQSMNVIKVVRSLGINPANGKELFLTKDGRVTEVWNADDKVSVGTTDPKLNGSFGVNAKYKSWTLSATFSYSYGGKAYNSTLAERVEGLNIYNNGDVRAFEERWKQPGDITFYKNIADRSTSYTSSRFVQDNNYLTMNNLAIYYRVPQAWLKRNLKMSMLKIGANMSDIFYSSTIKQERGLDYPFCRTVSFSLNASF